MRLGTLALSGAAPLLLGAAAILLCGGCDPQKSSTKDRADSFFKEPPQVVADAHTVRMASEPTEFLRRQAGASIHWQPWSREIFANAKAEQRPIFLLVASGRYEPCSQLLRRMDNEPSLISALHGNYICALADPEAHPELGLFAARLSAERGNPVQFPFIAWLSYEGNPISWLPLRPGDVEDFTTVWENSHAMVSKIWSESPRYVIFNSRRDNANRTDQLGIGSAQPADRATAVEATLATAARIAALFDPASNSIDGSGGLVPVTAINFSARAALDPASPPALLPRLVRLVERSGDSILRGAVRDPLDGGMFVGRRAEGWALPIFTKDSATQSAATAAYANSHALTGSPDALSGARAFADFNEAVFGEGGLGIGDYLALLGNVPDGRGFLWSHERLKELLSPDEFEVARAVFDIRGLGNIPPESDPRRLYFRRNSLAMTKTVAEAASALGRPETEVRTLLESTRKRVLAQRRELLQRADHLFLESTRITAVNARQVRALATLAQVTGERAYVERARVLLDYVKDRHYSEAGGLSRIPAGSRHRAVAARGEDYALLLAALLEVYRHDLDPAHLHWAEALATEALAKLGDDEAILLETPPEDRFGIFPIINDAMVFGPSTWGTIYGPMGQLQQLGPRPEFESLLAAIRARLVPQFARSHPFVHTDFAEAVLAEARGIVLQLEGSPEDATFQELHRAALAPEFNGITIIHLAPGLPEGFRLPVPGSGPKARVLRKGEDLGEAVTAPALKQLLRENLASG